VKINALSFHRVGLALSSSVIRLDRAKPLRDRSILVCGYLRPTYCAEAGPYVFRPASSENIQGSMNLAPGVNEADERCRQWPSEAVARRRGGLV
jgi:hypothetical protein